MDIGAELFAMSAACSRAQMLAKNGQKEAIALADTFCREARLRVEEHFRNLYGPNDENMYKLAMSVLKGEHAWLEHGIAAEDTEMGCGTWLEPGASDIRRLDQEGGKNWRDELEGDKRCGVESPYRKTHLPKWRGPRLCELGSTFTISVDNSTPVVRPVRKAEGSREEIAWPPKRRPSAGALPANLAITERSYENLLIPVTRLWRWSLRAVILQPTSPDASPDHAKGDGGGVVVSGSLTNDMFTFDNGTFNASDGGTFTVESLDRRIRRCSTGPRLRIQQRRKPDSSDESTIIK